jgi:erythronate-4-phosphate dehydrogenase
MRILADKNILFVKEAFARFGDVETVDGRDIVRERLAKNVDLLLVRSVTRVDAGLIDGTGVKFVASATSGTDHVDVGYLRERGIGFAYAPGSNATSVAEYVVSAVVCCATGKGRPLRDLTLGIIGAGNIGSRVAVFARALGMRCLLNDPPKQAALGGGSFLPLRDVLAESDIVTLHVPLDVSGPYRTLGMANETFFRSMKKGSAFFNTSRGKVADEAALKKHRDRLGCVVLDVWQNEPSPDPDTVSACDIATPHIAGYSYDGKVKGTEMICSAACAFFGRKDEWRPPRPETRPSVSITASDPDAAAAQAVTRAYPIAEDDGRFRAIVSMGPAERGAFFDAMRREYSKRLEFRNFDVHIPYGAPDSLPAMLAGLGFAVKLTGRG